MHAGSMISAVVSVMRRGSVMSERRLVACLYTLHSTRGRVVTRKIEMLLLKTNRDWFKQNTFHANACTEYSSWNQSVGLRVNGEDSQMPMRSRPSAFTGSLKCTLHSLMGKIWNNFGVSVWAWVAI